jgi:hypothetical protein
MNCIVCGEEIPKKCRRDKVYCSRACQMVAYRERINPYSSEIDSNSTENPSRIVTNPSQNVRYPSRTVTDLSQNITESSRDITNQSQTVAEIKEYMVDYLSFCYESLKILLSTEKDKEITYNLTIASVRFFSFIQFHDNNPKFYLYSKFCSRMKRIRQSIDNARQNMKGQKIYPDYFPEQFYSNAEMCCSYIEKNFLSADYLKDHENLGSESS